MQHSFGRRENPQKLQRERYLAKKCTWLAAACLPVLLANCRERSGAALLIAGDPRICSAADVQDEARRLLVPKLQDPSSSPSRHRSIAFAANIAAANVTIKLSDTALSMLDRRNLTAYCSSLVNSEIGSQQIRRTRFVYSVHLASGSGQIFVRTRDDNASRAINGMVYGFARAAAGVPLLVECPNGAIRPQC